MPDPPEVDLARLGRIGTRQDFADELTSLRKQAGLTVRQVASEVGGPPGTIGDWFAGRGLPSTTSRKLLVQVLTVCGASDAVIEQFLQAWQRVQRPPGRRAQGQEPYRGLASFQPEDVDWFFGRKTLTDQLLDRLNKLHAAGGGVQVVVGASGSGKSSLLRAGLIPALRASWRVVLFTPGSCPVDKLAAELAPSTGTSVAEMAEALRADPGRCAQYAKQAAAAAVGQGASNEPHMGDTTDDGEAHPTDDHQLVLVIDQFEEVFTACPDDKERRVFIAALCAAATGSKGALVVLGLRADFYSQALRYPQLVAAVQTQCHLA